MGALSDWRIFDYFGIQGTISWNHHRTKIVLYLEDVGTSEMQILCMAYTPKSGMVSR
jgi:hypothetical protein